MTEVKDMYKMALFIDSQEYDTPMKELFRNANQAIINGAERYAKKKKVPVRKAHAVLDNAIAHRYIRVLGDDNSGYVLDITHGRGRQLIAKKWLINRCGLREQTMKEYPRTQAMYKVKFVAIVGATATIMGAIGGIIVGHFWR